MLRTVVVDDSEDVRSLWCAALSNAGLFEICGVAANGAEALDAVRREQPDLVLLDLSMPGMNGLEVLSLLRVQSPMTKVVVVSSASRQEFARSAQSAQARGFLEKHLPVQSLAPRLLEMLDLPGDIPPTPADPTILAIDPDRDRRALLEYLVGWLPYRIRFVDDTFAALAELHTLDPSLVLVDTDAIATAGSEAWLGLRRVCAANGIAVVSMSHAGRTADDAAVSAGVVANLNHPIGAADLGAVLTRWGRPEPSAAGAPAHRTSETVRRIVRQLMKELGRRDAVAVWAAFERSSEQRRTALEAAILDGDATEVARLAHCLKDSCAAMGLPALAEVSAGLERFAESTNLTGASHQVGALHEMLTKVQAVAAEEFAECADTTHTTGLPAQRIPPGHRARATSDEDEGPIHLGVRRRFGRG